MSDKPVSLSLLEKKHAFNFKYNILGFFCKICKPLNTEVWAWVENIIMVSNYHQSSVKSEVHCLAMINIGGFPHMSIIRNHRTSIPAKV